MDAPTYLALLAGLVAKGFTVSFFIFFKAEFKRQKKEGL